MEKILLEKMNGWQRLWALTAGVLLFRLIVYGFVAFPTFEAMNMINKLEHVSSSIASDDYGRALDESARPCQKFRNLRLEEEFM